MLAYLAADNDLEGELLADLAEMERVGSTPGVVEVLAQVDRSPGQDTSNARKVSHPSGRFEFVSFEGAFHGRTMGALSATWNPKYREPFEPLVPGVRFLPWNDLAAVAGAVGDTTAAVMVEPIQGEGGIRPAAPEFLQGVARLCRERGALLMLDEVQSGLGRTGKMFAYQHAGVTPDILTLAKPLGGGLPMGAILIREDLATAIATGDHGSTFGGNPVAAAAALAVLDHLSAPGFIDDIAKRGAYLAKGLKKLARRLPDAIVEVRGLGLMIGVELKDEAGPVLKALRARGILATKAGERVLRLLPPLVVSRKDIRELLAALEAVLVERQPNAPSTRTASRAARSSRMSFRETTRGGRSRRTRCPLSWRGCRAPKRFRTGPPRSLSSTPMMSPRPRTIT